MAKSYVLYNLKAGNKTALEDVNTLKNKIDGEVEFVDVVSIKDYKEFLGRLEAEDEIILCGGDGTINLYINNTDGIEYSNKVLYYPMGTGNDFAADLGYKKGCDPFEITEYLKNLPFVTVKGKKYRVLNGVGYGIDGYCCEVGDAQKAKSDKPVNYTAIAIKGLLFHYKPTNATITVDGESHSFKKVWLAPTMNGRYYGGGMIPTPDQRRNNEEETVSTMVFHGSGKIKSLIVFPSIFKGEHVKHADMIKVFSGKEIKVEYDRPVALQIDGETILNVTEYTVEASSLVKKEEPVIA